MVSADSISLKTTYLESAPSYRCYCLKKNEKKKVISTSQAAVVPWINDGYILKIALKNFTKYRLSKRFYIGTFFADIWKLFI